MRTRILAAYAPFILAAVLVAALSSTGSNKAQAFTSPVAGINCIGGATVSYRKVGQTYTTCGGATTPGPGATPANGPDWTSGFVPYAANSIFNSPLPTATTFPFASDSTSVANTLYPSSDMGVLSSYNFVNEPGTSDDSFQVFFAKSTDPIVTISNCSPTGAFGVAPNCRGVGPGADPCGAGSGNIYIPANARTSNSATDQALVIVCPNGEEIDWFAGYGNTNTLPPGWSSGSPAGGSWPNPGTFNSSGLIGTDCGNFFTGAGFAFASAPNRGGGANSGGTVGEGGQCGGAGLMHPAELAAGNIPHALYLIAECTNFDGSGNAIYPANSSGGNSSGCGSGVPLVGERIWYDVPCNNTSPNHVGFVGTFTSSNSSLFPYEKAVLCALNQYGGFIMDNGANVGPMFTGLQIRAWGEASAFVNSSGDQGAQLATQGWSSQSVGGDWSAGFPRWNATTHADVNGHWTPPGVNMNGHIHVLCESATEGGVGCH